MAAAGCLALAGGRAPAAPSGADAEPLGGRPLALLEHLNRTMGLTHSELVRLDGPLVAGAPLRLAVEVAGRIRTLDLDVRSMRSDRFQVFRSDEDGRLTEIDPGPVATLRGVVVGEPGSVVAASVMDGGLYARIVLDDGTSQWIEPAAPRLDLPANDALAGLHVAYADEDVVPSGGTCGTTNSLAGASRGHAGAVVGDPVPAPAGNLPRRTEVACDADLAFFNRWGGNTTNRIETIFNQIDVQYLRDVDVRWDIVAVIIRTSQVYTTNDPEDLLNQFRTRWQSFHDDILRDVAHLFTGRNLSGSVIGIAFLNGICSSTFGYGLSQSDCCGSLACATDLSAHELGHNYSAQHCSCSGWTMNSGLQCANRFHPTFTIPGIVAFADSRNCLDRNPDTPPNDECDGAIAVSDGSTPYSTENATSGGPGENCPGSPVKDIWFLYTPTCTGTATASTCDADYNSYLSVYDVSSCPGAFLACSNDDCGEGGTRAELSFPVTQGQSVLVRVGGDGDLGTGTLVLSCVEGDPCPNDIDGSGVTDFGDVLAILAAWGNAGGPEDVDGSGTVDFGDILVILADWGTVCD